MKSEDWNKWELIYNGTEKGLEYLSQKQYDAFCKAVGNKESQIVLKDGRILPTWGARVRPNPDYFDPVELAKRRKVILANEERLRKKWAKL